MTSIFKNKNILISAGAIYENIDPVRFIGNRSSGKMGIEIANAFARLQANVTLVKANIHSNLFIEPNIKVVSAEDSEAMYQICLKEFFSSNITIMAAAIADYKAQHFSPHKIKKQEDSYILTLIKTKDILYELGMQKKSHQFLVGFALETENAQENAQEKMRRKNCDMMILNVLSSDNKIFGEENNSVTIYSTQKSPVDILPTSKFAIAKQIIQEISHAVHKKINF